MVNIGNILKGAASIALDVFAPGSRQAINVLLPDDKQLGPDSTGTDAQSVISSLPNEQQISILSKEIDLEIAQEEGWTARYQAMCKADGQSTRPHIALLMGYTMALEITAFTIWAFIYPDQMTNPALWTVFATLTGVPAGLLGKYFGELRREQRNRQETLGAPPMAGMAKTFMQYFKSEEK